ncbi:MAG: hypothetical protein WCL39_12145 [Armatimonadota bacterium]
MNESEISARLAVIDSRLADIAGHVLEVRQYIPAQIVEQTQRISTLEKAQRSLAWGLGAAAGGLLSAFIAHILGGS